MELLLKKSIRKNYESALKLTGDSECRDFLANLSNTERVELLAHVDGYAVPTKKRRGEPITQYFLLHYKEYMTNSEKEIFERADKSLQIIFAIFFVIAGAYAIMQTIGVI